VKIVNWQTLFTDHQLYTWQALQNLLAAPVLHVIATAESEARSRQGWKMVDVSGMEVIYLSANNWWAQGKAILDLHPDAVHVFGGFWADRRYLLFELYALRRGRKVAVMNESYLTESVGYQKEEHYVTSKFKVKLRPWLYRFAALMFNSFSSKHRLAVLAISNRAAYQHIQSGFSPSQVFSFGYFVPYRQLPNSKTPRRNGVIRLVFVGSLIHRKGLDILVQAVSNCKAQGCRVALDVYGYGDAGKYMPRLSDCISYRGLIAFGEAQAVIAQYDALVLPSRHDGWGVVVNEALLQGVPVIASENVGASCLVLASGAGVIFQNEDVAGLANILQRLSADHHVLQAWRRQAANVKKLIAPEAAGKYVYDVMMFHFYQVGERPRLECCEYQFSNYQQIQNRE
jgi:glycosyltransferase involved in cell wall biosynthesis